ncbi:hypothetical protein ADK59_35555 [Streptomyces sp. XY332]|nr:hypothetical protein ADK59_35555 [Streptomyces sp. XY332]
MLTESIAQRDQSSSPAGAEFVEDDAVEPGPDTGPAPLGEAPVDPLPARAEHRRKLPPGAARGRHEDDRGQSFAVIRPASAATLRTYDLRRGYHPPEQFFHDSYLVLPADLGSHSRAPQEAGGHCRGDAFIAG